jgi:hypothetical protein
VRRDVLVLEDRQEAVDIRQRQDGTWFSAIEDFNEPPLRNQSLETAPICQHRLNASPLQRHQQQLHELDSAEYEKQ